MNGAKMGAAALALVSALAVSAVGCASEPASEEQAEASSAIGANGGEIRECAQYPRNPACDAPLFLRAAWDLAVDNAWDNLLLPVANAVTCFSALRAAGAITGGIRAVAPRLVSREGALAVIGAVDGCKSLASYFDRIGIGANISCFIQPQLYDRDVHMCMCQNGCISMNGASSLAYIDAMNNCHCTNDAHEARCSLVGGCGEWATNDRNDPNYCACARPPL